MEEGRKVMQVNSQNVSFENRPGTTSGAVGGRKDPRDPSRTTPQSRPQTSQDGVHPTPYTLNPKPETLFPEP